MPPRVFLSLFALLSGAATALHADPTDDAIVAAMKLSTVVNYSWTTTLSENSRTAEIRGKTSADGYSLVTFKGFAAPAIVSSAKPGEINTVFQGDSKYVIESNGAWVVPTDKAATTSSTESGKGVPTGGSGNSAARGGRSRSGSRGGGGGGIGGGSPGQRRGGGGGGSGGERETSPTASGLKLPSGMNLPHEELAIIASNYSAMHMVDSVVNGTLTEWGADQLLMPPGSTLSPPDKAAGTFRLWIKGGAVTKYEVKLTAENGPGGVTIKGGVAETITVELTDVGATKVLVPPAAKLKLGV